jgi:diaminopimelate decarboxylase
MSNFHYKNGVLHAEDVSLDSIAEKVGTPCWVYSASALEERYKTFAAAFAGFDATICYSVKANSNQAVISTFARLGSGADVVSVGELHRARAAGIPPKKIVFAGVGKTADEMAAALKIGILQFNVESEPELRLLSHVASRLKKKAPVTLRVNPDVDAETHHKITTGKKENKFGIDIADAREIAKLAASLPGIEMQGLAVHIGSQITEIDPFAAAFARLGELANTLIADGHQLRRLDFGGGLGVTYDSESPPPLEISANANNSYVGAVRGALDLLPNRGKGIGIIFEPGRWLVANAGILLTRVNFTKVGSDKSFVIVDAAMNDLIRPTLYESFHRIRPVRETTPDAATAAVDVVGPVCETGDYFALDRALPALGEGALVAVEDTGAYGATMSSTYNTRPLAPELLVKQAKFAVVRPRQSLATLIGLDRLPPWLGKPSKSSKQPKKGVSRQVGKSKKGRRKS